MELYPGPRNLEAEGVFCPWLPTSSCGTLATLMPSLLEAQFENIQTILLLIGNIKPEWQPTPNGATDG